MTKERDPLDLDTIDFKIDLRPLDFDLPNLDLGDLPDLKLDLDSLDGLLDFNVDGIGAGFDAEILLTPINARGGVLAGGPQKCGALTRKGTQCRCKPLPGKQRCKFHGGASTGPKTPEGRERIAEAQRRRWARWRGENYSAS